MAARRKKPTPRILRIGILLGDTFIEERLIREQKPVTVGQSARNLFSIPIEKMPRSWTLFDRTADGYVLRINKRMTGRVALDGKPRSLENLKGHEAREADDHWVLPLSERSRGKIELGEMKLLFQFVAAPPVQPRPRLPASVRGTLGDRIDPRLGMILAISLVAHLAIALWAFQHDQVKERHAQKRLKEFREERFKQRTITMADRPTATDADKGEAAAAEKSKPKRAERSETPGGGQADSGEAPSDAALRDTFRRDPVLDVLGFGTEGPGRYEGSEDIDQGTGLDKGMDDLKDSGQEVVAFGKGDRGTRGPEGGEVAGDRSGGEVTGPTGGGGAKAKKEERITSRASLSGIQDESFGTLDPAKVARKIRRRYRRGLQKCHERLLKVNPKAGGRVQLRFTVGPTGRVTRASAKGFNNQVDTCIERLMRRWRFGTPKDEDGKPTQARFSIPVLLKAGN